MLVEEGDLVVVGNTTETNTVEAAAEAAVEAAEETPMQIAVDTLPQEEVPMMICGISSAAWMGNHTELTTILTRMQIMGG